MGYSSDVSQLWELCIKSRAASPPDPVLYIRDMSWTGAHPASSRELFPVTPPRFVCLIHPSQPILIRFHIREVVCHIYMTHLFRFRRDGKSLLVMNEWKMNQLYSDSTLRSGWGWHWPWAPAPSAHPLAAKVFLLKCWSGHVTPSSEVLGGTSEQARLHQSPVS